MGNKLQSVCVALIGAIGGASPAFADNCSGTYTAVTTAYEVVEVDKGHTVAFAANRNSAASSQTLYNGVGACAATILTTPDGKFQMKYNCVRKSADGDSWSIAGTLDSSSDKGTWTTVAGTGKYASQVGSSGWWKPVVNDGKMELGLWGGNCK